MVSKPSTEDFREGEAVPVLRLHLTFKPGPWRVDAQRRIGTQQVNAEGVLYKQGGSFRHSVVADEGADRTDMIW